MDFCLCDFADAAGNFIAAAAAAAVFVVVVVRTICGGGVRIRSLSSTATFSSCGCGCGDPTAPVRWDGEVSGGGVCTMELLSKLRLGRSSLRVLLSLAPCDDEEEEEDGEGKEEDNMI